MRPWIKSLWHGVQFCADCIVLLACWALWLALGGLLAAQIGVMISREMAVPAFVLRSMEERFRASNVNVRFGRATFDPTGRILLEKLTLTLPEFAEPVFNARAVLIELDPWSLIAGELDARRVHAAGVQLSVPAMLTPSGQSEELLHDLDFSIATATGELQFEHFTARIAGVALEAHGHSTLPRKKQARPIEPLPLVEILANNFAPFCRQLVQASRELAAFDDPQLNATLAPSAAHGSIATLQLTARHLKPGARYGGLEAHDLRATVELPVLGETTAASPLTFTARKIRFGQEAQAMDVSAHLRGVLNLTSFSFVPRTADLTVGEVSAHGFTVRAVSAQNISLLPGAWNLDLVALCLDSTLGVTGPVNLAEKTAKVRVQGALAPGLLIPIGQLIGQDVRRFVDFGQPMVVDLDASFKSGWKFEKVAGHIAAKQIAAYHVAIDSADGDIEFDGRHFLAQNARATLGENQARGSFEQDLATLEFRFLLEGHLRPLEIGGWFGPWWPDFFQHFKFPAGPPDASVDVAGRWQKGYETTVFVFAESKSPTIRDTPLDYGRTLMFIRPNFFDALEFFATRGAGSARGTFDRHIDQDRKDWSKMNFAMDSTLDLQTGTGLLGPEIARRLAFFTFENPPHVQATGRLDGPAAPGGEHQTMKIKSQSTGAFSIYKFPVRDVSFEAELHDDELLIENVEAMFAHGVLKGRARLTGPEADQKLDFDGTLREALLSEAVNTVANFSAQRRGEPAAAAPFVFPGKSPIKFDLSLAAAGQFNDLLSYRGTGDATVTGAELGEVRLFGLLSAMLEFTALRFTTARLNFQLQGSKIAFPMVSVTGANSAIDGHGEYFLDRGEMEFKARVYPFQESKSILQSVVGTLLLPLSSALEVKLTGPLKQPNWAFVIGPTNLIRSLTGPSNSSTDRPANAAPATVDKP